MHPHCTPNSTPGANPDATTIGLGIDPNTLESISEHAPHPMGGGSAIGDAALDPNMITGIPEHAGGGEAAVSVNPVSDGGVLASAAAQVPHPPGIEVPPNELANAADPLGWNSVQNAWKDEPVAPNVGIQRSTGPALAKSVDVACQVAPESNERLHRIWPVAANHPTKTESPRNATVGVTWPPIEAGVELATKSVPQELPESVERLNRMSVAPVLGWLRSSTQVT